MESVTSKQKPFAPCLLGVEVNVKAALVQISETTVSSSYEESLDGEESSDDEKSDSPPKHASQMRRKRIKKQAKDLINDIKEAMAELGLKTVNRLMMGFRLPLNLS